MTAIATLFWHICTFRGGPDSVPANTWLLACIILLNAGVSLTAAVMLNNAATEAIAGANEGVVAEDVAGTVNSLTLMTQVVVSQASTAGLTWIILFLTSLTARFQQTLGALFGADILITGVTAVLVSVLFAINPTLGTFAILGSMIWTIATFGYIYHRALDTALGLGIGAAIFVLLFSIAISQVAVSP